MKITTSAYICLLVLAAYLTEAPTPRPGPRSRFRYQKRAPSLVKKATTKFMMVDFPHVTCYEQKYAYNRDVSGDDCKNKCLEDSKCQATVYYENYKACGLLSAKCHSPTASGGVMYAEKDKDEQGGGGDTDHEEEVDKSNEEDMLKELSSTEISYHGVSKTCGKSLSSGAGKVIGGTKSKSHQWPWIVRLKGKKDTDAEGVLCGSTLINRWWLMGASHCFVDDHLPMIRKAYNWQAVIGEHAIEEESRDKATFNFEKIIPHPNYDTTTYQNDIALLKLERPAEIGNGVNVACLPQRGRTFRPKKKCYIAGWGLTDYEEYELGEDTRALQLEHATVQILDNEQCAQMWEGMTDVTGEEWRGNVLRTNKFLCAYEPEGGVDACKGDSGGPLMCRKHGQYVAAGAVSNGKDCGIPDFPGVYTNVSNYLDWIEETLKNE